MKKLLIALAAVIVSVASFAQGTVTFNTRITGVLDAPVLSGASGLGVGPDYTGELFVVSGATPGVIAASKTPFRSGSELAQRYVTTVSEVAIPGVDAGGNVKFRFRAYKTSAGSWDAAGNDRGASADFSIASGSLGGGLTPPANLVGITGFSVGGVIPEPSTIALGVLGAAALLFRRRK